MTSYILHMVFNTAPQPSRIQLPHQRAQEVAVFVSAQSGKIKVSLLPGSQQERRNIEHGYTGHIIYGNSYPQSCILADPHSIHMLEKSVGHTDTSFYKGTLVQRGQDYYLDYNLNGQPHEILIETGDTLWISNRIAARNLLTQGSASLLSAAQNPSAIARASRSAVGAILQNGAILGANFPASNHPSIPTPVQPQTTSVSTAPVASPDYGALLRQTAPKPAPPTHEQKLAMLDTAIQNGNYEIKPRLPKNEDMGKQVMLVRGTDIIAQGTLSTHTIRNQMMTFNPPTETTQFTIVAPTANNPNRNIKLQGGECVYFQKPSLPTDEDPPTSSN